MLLQCPLLLGILLRLCASTMQSIGGLAFNAADQCLAVWRCFDDLRSSLYFAALDVTLCICAGSASAVYLTFGGVQWDYALLMMVTAHAVTYAGQKLTYYIIEMWHRRSVVIIAMATLLTVGAAIMAVSTSFAVERAWPDKFWQFDTFCGRSGS